MRRECEDLGGSAVNIARSMLASEGIFIWEDPSCDKIVAPVKKASDPIATSTTGIIADCWPNPSSGRLLLRFSASDLKGRLRIFDATGKTLLAKAFAYNGQPLEVDGSSWAQGLLSVQVELADGSLFSWRIVLQR